MLHRALFGSLERFIGILLENYSGHLPLWLSPTHAVVATITDQSVDYAKTVAGACRPPGCGSRRTCATRRSATRCASTARPRSR